MKSVLAIALLCGLILLSSSASAQECETIEKVRTYSKGNFAKILGDKIDDDITSSTYKLPDAKSCEVEHSEEFGYEYRCEWYVATGLENYKEARQAWGETTKLFESCFHTSAIDTWNTPGNPSDFGSTFVIDKLRGDDKAKEIWGAEIMYHWFKGWWTVRIEYHKR